MKRNLVVIDGRRLEDWDSFHGVFANAFGFPDFYGCNMNAWIDCMSSLSDPEEGMSTIHCEKGQVVTIQVEHASELKANHPVQYEALIEGAAFVNWRLIEQGEPPVLALSFNT
ncbi:barstar family protein [Rubinisphaera italica]|uniref:Barstar (Barnase inhibitor) n=1 Tax=Rubinisphaera italica TaxID=2527969 RepID=A0A5C5XMC9_9PLAN|nr:barstar family protein [Rubinisphaera italica]TWT63611.1 Barstar (barnase inhibitor) [Rubinisphaera italica]